VTRSGILKVLLLVNLKVEELVGWLVMMLVIHWETYSENLLVML